MPVQGDSAAAFVPKHWHVLEKIQYGDLNKDQLDDAAFVIESDDTLTEYLYDAETGKYDNEAHTNSRILIVLFKKTNGKCQLALQNNDFILRQVEGGICCDPYTGMSIKNGTLIIPYSGGLSRNKWENTYIFRYQDNDWFLIGASAASIYIDYGDPDDAAESHSVRVSQSVNSYNFMTGKEETRESDDVDNPSMKVRSTWRTLPKTPLRTFKTFIRPMTWEIEKGVYL